MEFETEKSDNITSIIESLPHGSGIDCKWEIDTNDKWIIAKNSFHCMNQDGYYVGYADFTVKIPVEFPESFKLEFNGKTAQYRNRKFGLREYLEDTLYYAIKNRT